MYTHPENELYTIIQQFYSGKYQDIAALHLTSEFDFTDILHELQAHFYKVRSLIILQDYQNALTELSEIDSKLSSALSNKQIDQQTVNILQTDSKVLASFIDFKKTGDINTSLLDSINEKEPTIALIYKNIIQNKNQSNNPSDENLYDIESLIHLLLTNPSSSLPQKITQLKSNFNDSLVVDFVVAWLGLFSTLSSNDSINSKNSYYFFEELTSSPNTDSLKNTLSLLVSHAKLGDFYEANNCLSKIESLKDSNLFLDSWNYSYLINKIALAVQSLNTKTQIETTNELVAKFPNSPYVQDYNQKSAFFDEIAQSYLS